MKIVHITGYFSPHQGGIENVARELLGQFAKKGHQVEVFTSNIGCPKNKQLKSTKNFKINYLPAWEFAHTPIIPSLFWKLMKIPQDSIIHVHVAQALITEVVWLVSKLRGVSYIAHLHGNVKPSGKFGFLLPLYQKFVFRKAINDAAKIIVLTDEYKHFFKETYHLNNQIKVIPNGIKKDFFFIKKKKHSGINLLYVGRLSPEKNINILIEAVSLLKNKAILHIVGDGEKREELKKLVKIKKLKNVILHGRKEGKDLIELYKRADISLLASNSEGQPLFLMESMASGIPIIGSDVRGIHELIRGIGILINPPTPKNFAKAIDKLIENPKLRKELSKKGIEKAKQYSWDKIVEQTEQVYKEVLAEHNKKLKLKNKNDTQK